jgi:hypothetical protein
VLSNYICVTGFILQVNPALYIAENRWAQAIKVRLHEKFSYMKLFDNIGFNIIDL